jgi:protein-tyrosine-phosphatase
MDDVTSRDRVGAATAALMKRYAGGVDPATVARLAADSAAALEALPGDTTVGRQAIQQLTNDRIRVVLRAETSAANLVPSVMFLCVHNAGRSQMAAGWMRHLGGARVDVFGGGSEPGVRVNPSAVEVMAERGIDISEALPQPWSDDVVRAMDVVVTMGCGDECPFYPGTRYVDWELQDPAGKSVDAVRPVRDEIERRVRGLLADLGVEPEPA